MPKMFEIDNYVLRESARQLDRDKNKAFITLVYEPKLGKPIPYRRDNRVQFMLMIEDGDVWEATKDAGADPLIEIIDEEVQRYKKEREAFIKSEGVPAPYPQFFPEVVEFLADKQYSIVTME